MPRFDLTRQAPQTQAQSSGPRDMGLGIQIQAAQQAAEGVSSLVSGFESMARKRVQEQAESDMSAFQAHVIKQEQIYEEGAAKAKNSKELKKLTDKYIKDLELYAMKGKREDGNPVFRNNMGKNAFKEFNKTYAAKFEAQGNARAFEMDRKRDRLNYQIAIDSGIKENNPNAITQSYESLVNAGHITREEAKIKQQEALEQMTITHLTELNAHLMIGVEEKLNNLYQQEIKFDGTGPKKYTDTLEEATKSIKGSFENYKAEVLSNPMLTEVQKKNLIDHSKAGLKSLEYRKKAQFDQQKQQQERNYNMAQIEYLARSIQDPTADQAQLQAEILQKYGKSITPKDQISMLKNIKEAQDRAIKAQTDKAAEVELKAEKTAVESLVYEYDPANDMNGNKYRDLINRVEGLEGHPAKTRLKSFLEEQNPFKADNSSPLGIFTRESTMMLKAELGLNLTEAEYKKLPGERRKAPYEPWFGAYDFTEEEIAEHKDSVEKFYDFAPESMRDAFLNKVIRDAQDMFKDNPQGAKDFIKTQVNELKKTQNDYKFINNFLNTGQGATLKANPYDMIR